MKLETELPAGVVVGVVASSSSSATVGSGVDGFLFFEERPGKSGTRTVTSDSSSSKLGSGVVVVVVVDVVGAAVVVDDVVDVGETVVVSLLVVSDSGVAPPAVLKTDGGRVESGVVAAAAAAAAVSAGVGIGVVVVGDDVVVFCSPNVFQMDGPTELNHGGLGLDVEDAGVAAGKRNINMIN